MRPIAIPIGDFLNFVFGPPRYTFHRELYAKLVRKMKNGKSVAAPNEEPRVVFERGPMDGVLGYLDKENVVHVDELENFVASTQKPAKNEAEALQNFDNRLTETLAHEGGHWQLHKRQGFWPMFERFLIFGIMALVGFMFIFGSLWFGWRLITLNIIMPLFAGNRILAAIAAIVFWIIWFVFLGRATRSFFGLWMVISSVVTYTVCPDERFARKFAKEAMTDPEWAKVVEVPSGQ